MILYFIRNDILSNEPNVAIGFLGLGLHHCLHNSRDLGFYLPILVFPTLSSSSSFRVSSSSTYLGVLIICNDNHHVIFSCFSSLFSMLVVFHPHTIMVDFPSSSQYAMIILHLGISILEGFLISMRYFLAFSFFFLTGKFLSPLGLEPRTSHKPSPSLYHLSQASRARYFPS